MSIVSQTTFPNVSIDIQDNPPTPLAQNTVLPLHLPHFFCFAAQGPTNVPTLGSFGALQSIFGAQTFNPRGPFYQHPTLFALTACQFQQIYFTRLIDPEAAVGTLVLQCSVTPVPAMIQYQRTNTGALILTSGQPTPMLQSDGTTPVTAPGVLLTWSTRAITSDELTNGISHLQPTTAMVSGQQVTTYPILAIMGTSPGSAINDYGFSLYYTASFDASVVSNIGGLTYRWVPTVLNPSLNITSTIFDQFNDAFNDISFMDSSVSGGPAVDPTTNTYYDLADIINNNYAAGSIPYVTQTFGSNFLTMAQAVLAVSPELVTADTSPWMINLLSGVDQNGNTYEHFQVASSSATVLNQNVVLYAEGGTDGDTSITKLETLTQEYVAGNVNPLIADNLRYPFTHIYDSGYTLATKTALLNIWNSNMRDDVKIDFSTQDLSNPPNTQAQDQSTGSSLRASILLHPESLLFGTQAIRASIYQQCGYLNPTNPYKGLVVATLDRLIKRCIYDGTQTIKGTPKGRPNSEVTIFNPTTLNWSPSSAAQKQLSWSTGLNYISYCDVATLFYADLRSVYPIDSSVLSDDVFVDRLVYMKYIARRIWSIYVGIDESAQLFNIISKAIDKAIYAAFNGSPSTLTTVYQTAIDQSLGYQLTVSIATTSGIPNRVWKVLVPVSLASTAATGN